MSSITKITNLKSQKVRVDHKNRAKYALLGNPRCIFSDFIKLLVRNFEDIQRRFFLTAKLF